LIARIIFREEKGSDITKYKNIYSFNIRNKFCRQAQSTGPTYKHNLFLPPHIPVFPFLYTAFSVTKPLWKLRPLWRIRNRTRALLDGTRILLAEKNYRQRFHFF
jgi:hypothetical protein